MKFNINLKIDTGQFKLKCLKDLIFYEQNLFDAANLEI